MQIGTRIDTLPPIIMEVVNGYTKGNYHWRDPCRTSMIMAGSQFFFVSEGSVLQVFVIADRYSNRVSFVSFNSQKQLRQSTSFHVSKLHCINFVICSNSLTIVVSMFCDIDNSPIWRLQRQWMKAYGCSRCYTATWAKLWDLWEAYHPMTRVVGENMGWMLHGFMGWWCLIGWFFEWRKNLGWFCIFLSHETFIKCGLLYLMNYMEPRRTMYVGYIIIFGVVHPFLRSNRADPRAEVLACDDAALFLAIFELRPPSRFWSRHT